MAPRINSRFAGEANVDVKVRFTENERDIIQRLARASNRSMSNYIRHLVLRAAIAQRSQEEAERDRLTRRPVDAE